MDPLDKLRTMRAGLGGVVELLVAMIDDLDGDENLEDSDDDKQVDDDRCDVPDSGDDEPSIGSGYGAPDLELDDSDNEPSLGRLETVYQGSASYGDSSDREVCILSEPHDSDEALV
jgi:hypothetical protein